MGAQERKQTAETILEQLGGNKFVAMTGAKNIGFGEKGELNFKIGRNAKKVTHVRIELGGDDLYTMQFFNVRGANIKTVGEVEGVYAEQLQSIFTQNTGMDTHL